MLLDFHYHGCTVSQVCGMVLEVTRLAAADCLYDFDIIHLIQGVAVKVTAGNDLLVDLYGEAFFTQVKVFQKPVYTYVAFNLLVTAI